MSKIGFKDAIIRVLGCFSHCLHHIDDGKCGLSLEVWMECGPMCQEGCSVSLWGLGNTTMDAILSHIRYHNRADNDLLFTYHEL